MPNLFNKKTRILLFNCAVLAFILIPLCPVLAAQSSYTELPNPIKCPDLLCVIIGVTRLFLGAVGAFGVFVFCYGGFLMLTSAGNAETIKKAKDVLIWATLGIIVIIGSWAFLNYILHTVASVTR